METVQDAEDGANKERGDGPYPAARSCASNVPILRRPVRLYTVLGCLVESIGMIVITVPLLFPVLGHYGIEPDLVRGHSGHVCGLGQISPPIGINLFVIQSIWEGKLSDVVMGTIPFHVIMFVLLIL